MLSTRKGPILRYAEREKFELAISPTQRARHERQGSVPVMTCNTHLSPGTHPSPKQYS